MRLYVFVTSIDPLKVYLHQEGMVRQLVMILICVENSNYDSILKFTGLKNYNIMCNYF